MLIQLKYQDGTILEDELRNLAIAICKYACDNDNGRTEDDPVYKEITEGRQVNANNYSSCADQGHFILKTLGITDERVMNRTDDDGSVPWIMGANISMLKYGGTKVGCWVDWKKDLIPNKGDICLIMNDNATAHILICESFTEDIFHSYDYGQFFSKLGKHGGKKRERPIKNMLGGKYLDGRRLQGWIDLTKLPLPAWVDVKQEILDFL